MERIRYRFLLDWLKSTARKPLVIRGARQVGKAWLVRQFAQQEGLDLIELNFEKNPEYGLFFSSNEPKEILFNIYSKFKRNIEPSKSLLFLDEIQANRRSILLRLKIQTTCW